MYLETPLDPVNPLACTSTVSARQEVAEREREGSAHLGGSSHQSNIGLGIQHQLPIPLLHAEIPRSPIDRGFPPSRSSGQSIGHAKDGGHDQVGFLRNVEGAHLEHWAQGRVVREGGVDLPDGQGGGDSSERERGPMRRERVEGLLGVRHKGGDRAWGVEERGTRVTCGPSERECRMRGCRV